MFYKVNVISNKDFTQILFSFTLIRKLTIGQIFKLR